MSEPLRIVMLDSVPTDAELNVQTLRAAGFDFVFRRVETEEDFLGAVDDFEPDVILAAHSVPRLDGPAALALVQERAPHIPTIIVTGFADAGTAVECMKAGAADYVLKKELDRLGPALRTVLEKKALRESEQAARRLSEERSYAMTQAAPLAVVTGDANGVVRSWNPGATALFGYTEAEILGQPITVLMPERYREAHVSSIASFESTGRSRVVGTTLELVGLQKDGSEFPIELSLSSWRFRGAPWFGAHIRDIGERKRAEEALARSEAKHRSIVEHAIYGIYRSTPDEMFISANPALVSMLGYDSEEEVLALSVDDLFAYAGDRAETLEGLGDRDRVEGLELRWKRKDGSTILVRESGRRVAEEGSLVFEMIVEDVTEARETERTRDLLSAAVEQASDLVIITDTDGTIEYVNPAFEKVTGYGREEAIGQNPRLLKSGGQSAEFYQRMWKQLTAGRPWTAEFLNRKKDGSEYRQRSRIYPIKDGSGRTISYVGISTDITDERKMEERLRQAQKMEAVGQLTAGVAHDFNNVLSVIGLNAEVALMDCAAGVAPDRDGLRTITDAVQRATKITKQLLGFSRQAQLTIEPVDLTGVVRGLTKMIRTGVPENIRLGIAADAPVTTVDVDAAAVEQILLNLVTNARDAMPDGGGLDIEVHERVVDGTYRQTHPHVKPGAYVAIDVTDTGVGMDAETVSRVFEPFFSTKPFGAGTGLGLSMVYGLAKQQRGHVHVYSEPGVGTTMTVLFPVSGDALRTDEKTPSKTGVTTGSETILVVEDDEAVRRAAKRALERHGYTVLTSVDGEEGLTKYRANASAIDLVISDLVMPQIGGRALVQALRKESEGLRIILTSGYSAQESAELERVEGSLPFLRKPWDLATLLDKVREVLDGGVDAGLA